MKQFISKNKVVIAAVVAAIIMTLQQATQSGETSWKAIGLAVLFALIGVFANQWKGKGLTITGILGTLANAFITIQQTGQFSWDQFIMSAIIALLLAVSGSLQPEPHEEPQSKLPYSARQ
jgi:peptidoglycan/LPS O-acetylase OafA/YrhL